MARAYHMSAPSLARPNVVSLASYWEIRIANNNAVADISEQKFPWGS